MTNAPAGNVQAKRTVKRNRNRVIKENDQDPEHKRNGVGVLCHMQRCICHIVLYKTKSKTKTQPVGFQTSAPDDSTMTLNINNCLKLFYTEIYLRIH